MIFIKISNALHLPCDFHELWHLVTSGLEEHQQNLPGKKGFLLFFVGLKCDCVTLPRIGKFYLREHQEWRVPYGVFLCVFQRQLQ